VPLIPRRLCLPALAVALSVPPIWAAPPPGAPAARRPEPLAASPGGSVSLSLRRPPGAVELVIEGVGSTPVLSQGGSAGGAWNGQLRLGAPNGLRFGPQRMALPEAGLQSVSLSGGGSDYRLEVVPLPGAALSRPVVSADGRNLVISFASAGLSAAPAQQTAAVDLRQPGLVPQPAYAPPLQPRAVAPPLGDMAVGSMVLRNPSFIHVSGPAVTLTLRNAPAKDALMALAQLGGYGFVYVGDASAAGSSQAAAPAGASGGSASNAGLASDGGGRPVTIAFRNESYARALNSVLLAAGLQGKQEGNLIMAGPNVLAKSFGPQLSKVFRLNQASASSAADYLASLGAAITKVTVITNSVTQGTPQANQVAGGSTSQQTSTQNLTTTETYGGGVGPLKGLLGTTDSRLQTITLIGDAGLVAVAEGYLRQIDLRQRQVALSVKILDVTLDNDAAVSNSFAFRYGNNFIVNDQGQLVGSFGNLLPPRDGPPGQFPTAGTGIGYPYNFSGPPSNPGQSYPANNFFDVVKALITSSSAKTLASPTLFLTDNPELNQSGQGGGSASASSASGGAGSAAQIQPVTNPSSPIGRNFANEAFVVVGENVVQSYQVTAGQGTAPNTCSPVFGVAGLTLGARVKRIDDNGFVTFNLSPSITAVTRSTTTVQGCGSINTLIVRALDTGDVRVRDGQTLILTGVISDSDIQVVRKWPILGDIPFVGQFFRDSGGGRKKRELVVLVTPRVIADGEAGVYGYGYRPESREARVFSGLSN
jgi:type IV pilus assembly protein PilQ